MGNCKDCKHWEFQLGEQGLCKVISTPEHPYNDSDRLAYIVDYGPPTHLVTKGDFGCVLFEANGEYQQAMDNQPALCRQARRDILRWRASTGAPDAIEALRVEYGESV